MLLLGIDLGTSSIKVSVFDSSTSKTICSVTHPEQETGITSLQAGWAEQTPNTWWQHVKEAIQKAHQIGGYNPLDISAIGISYQMHGLVIVDKEGTVIRDSIIWCDSRAVPFGESAAQKIGIQHSLENLLNTPGNFTAAKLAWVKANEPENFKKVAKVMLPGDFIAYRLTGEITTTASALSEGIFWDFKTNALSNDVLNAFGFEASIIPQIKDVFTEHGFVTNAIAAELKLRAGIPVTYKAGDQPNNAFSLQVLNPGELATTAGTSGVVYGVSDQISYDPKSRVNCFAHVNHTNALQRIGVLLCVNGTGILNSWLRSQMFGNLAYNDINALAQNIQPGSEGLQLFPFGNGAERILENRAVGASVANWDFNRHKQAHFARAAQEGIVFALQYGMEIMKDMGIAVNKVKAGKANMFLSPVFKEIFANTSGAVIELYNTDGSVGAARAAGLGLKLFANEKECFKGMELLEEITPSKSLNQQYQEIYQNWKSALIKQLH